MSVKEEPFLYCEDLAHALVRAWTLSNMWYLVGVHRLKLVTGVEISARPVRRFGRRGKAVNNKKRNAAAEA